MPVFDNQADVHELTPAVTASVCSIHSRAVAAPSGTTSAPAICCQPPDAAAETLINDVLNPTGLLMSITSPIS
ncbi:hypothetical protein, partial [Mycobacterium sp. 1465703.0]|uniref:hypothetical protein n=1 Tax=Mycobacterium sp. 1465703.0 TaxID=1834078 RepID=UPI001E50B2FB